jgi:hypothetical protein
MSSLLLPWITRGIKYDSREYLASITLGRASKPAQQTIAGAVDSDTLISEAVPILASMRGTRGEDIEYGCFDLDGTIIHDRSKLLSRQIRNILYYTIRDLYNLSRGRPSLSVGAHATFLSDPVPETPEGNWAVLITTECKDKKEIERALKPLVEKRSGTIITVPKLEPEGFLAWVAHIFGIRDISYLPPDLIELDWVRQSFSRNNIPRYLLVCDSFDNFPLEYQFILNAFAVSGRLWFDNPEDFDTYVNKVVQVERGQYPHVGKELAVASPVDDTVTDADNKNIIWYLRGLPLWGSAFRAILKEEFNRETLLESARLSLFLALYCHGVGALVEDYHKDSNILGAFVLDFESPIGNGLLTYEDIADIEFVPGGIFFSPACLAGGTQENSDFANWIEKESLLQYLGLKSGTSKISQELLKSRKGPIASFMHFDISMSSNAPMPNPQTGEYDLQTMLHERFVGNLMASQTLGKATQPFRWAAGTFYAEAIRFFEQIAGTCPLVFKKEPTIGQSVNEMNRYHVIATDMRNYIILGDPAVRLIR